MSSTRGVKITSASVSDTWIGNAKGNEEEVVVVVDPIVVRTAIVRGVLIGTGNVIGNEKGIGIRTVYLWLIVGIGTGKESGIAAIVEIRGGRGPGIVNVGNVLEVVIGSVFAVVKIEWTFP